MGNSRRRAGWTKSILNKQAKTAYNPNWDLPEIRKEKEKNPDPVDKVAPRAGDLWTCPECGRKHEKEYKHCKCGLRDARPADWVAQSDRDANLLKWGLIIGAIVLTLILIAALFCCLRKKRRRRRPPPMMAPPGMSVTPYSGSSQTPYSGYSRTPGSSAYSSYYSGTPGYSRY